MAESHPASAVQRRPRVWAALMAFLIVGYFSMSRSFAYIGIPPLKLFIGEIVLVTMVLFRFRAIVGRWIRGLVTPGALTSICWGFAIFLALGALELCRGLVMGYPFVVGLQNFAFNYYPIFLFAGAWIAARDRTFLVRVLRYLAWFNGVYGTLYVLFFGRLTGIVIPGSDAVSVFGQPSGSAIAILGLLAFEKDLRKVLIPLLLNAFVLLGVQVRAEWLGFGFALLLWGLLSGQFRRIAWGGALIVLLLAVGFITDLRLPSPSGRGGAIAVRELVARGIAPVNQDLAAQYSETADMYAGTFAWRVGWWIAIWEDITEARLPVRLFGEGYGYPLRDLVSYIDGTVRTPHNIFFYALGYTGWVGVVLFFGFQFLLCRGAWRVFRKTSNAFALAFWALGMTAALFGNFLETPFGAVPFYLLLGAVLGGNAAPLRSGHRIALPKSWTSLGGQGQ